MTHGSFKIYGDGTVSVSVNYTSVTISTLWSCVEKKEVHYEDQILCHSHDDDCIGFIPKTNLTKRRIRFVVKHWKT